MTLRLRTARNAGIRPRGRAIRSSLAEGRVNTSWWSGAPRGVRNRGGNNRDSGSKDGVMRLLRVCCVAGIFAAALSFTHLSFTRPTFAGGDVTGSLPKDTAIGTTSGSTSGLPVPRFVSLKSDHVNVRGGPTKDNDVSWIYTRSGLPVEITAEFENWRRVRDSEGSEGWVYHSLLSGRRTAVVTMKTKDELASLYDRPDRTSAIAARLQAGVVTQVKKCANGWCRVIGTGFDGWIEQQRLWGVYADEKVE